jgi:hypothetical protein
MAVFGCEVVNELGEVLASSAHPIWVLQPILDRLDPEQFPQLRFLDPYGDAVFNHLQVGELIREIDNLRTLAETDAQRAAVQEIGRLANMTIGEGVLGRYLKFLGD